MTAGAAALATAAGCQPAARRSAEYGPGFTRPNRLTIRLAPDPIRSAIGLVVVGVSGRRASVSRRAGCREPDQEWLIELIHDVRPTSGARHRDLARQLRTAIASGEVPVGARLPPQRELARLLSIGRTTVVAAYNLLRAESLVVARQGAGTWVARRPVPGRRPDGQ